MYKELNKKHTFIKKWNQALLPKAILLFPPITFALTFMKINTYKSTLDLLGFVAVGGLLVSGGVFLIIFYPELSNEEINYHKCRKRYLVER